MRPTCAKAFLQLRISYTTLSVPISYATSFNIDTCYFLHQRVQDNFNIFTTNKKKHPFSHSDTSIAQNRKKKYLSPIATSATSLPKLPPLPLLFHHLLAIFYISFIFSSMMVVKKKRLLVYQSTVWDFSVLTACNLLLITPSRKLASHWVMAISVHFLTTSVDFASLNRQNKNGFTLQYTSDSILKVLGLGENERVTVVGSNRGEGWRRWVSPFFFEKKLLK